MCQGQGNATIGTICIITIGFWVWESRGELDEVAQEAAQTAADPNGECGSDGKVADDADSLE